MLTNSTKKLQGAGIAASVAMALAACASNPPPAAQMASGADKVQCKEANSCKGNATCAGTAKGEKHTCKGANACAGNVRELSKEDCDAIKGTVVQ